MEPRSSSSPAYIGAANGSAVATGILNGPDLRPAPAPGFTAYRVSSIDIVRGLAMVFMALDHTRDYITNYPFAPTSLGQTWLFLFLVRWVTHYCAPAFFLLTGVGAYLYGRKHSPPALQKFLITRGLWLAFLEVTVVGFGWSFHPGFFMFGVIISLGLSMIILAAVARLPRYVIMAVALLVMTTHDLFDRIAPAVFQAHPWLYFIHGRGPVQVGSTWLLVLFPLVPWCAVTMLGFSIGFLFEDSSRSTRRTLLIAGGSAILLFAVLRLTDSYGNPAPPVAYSSPGDWHLQPTIAKSLIVFLDVEKYPASLQYLLMTLGPVLVLLSLAGSFSWGAAGRVLQTFGRVPLFFYLLHIYLIHLLAAALAGMTHQPAAWLFHGAMFSADTPDTYGHSIGIACLVWLTAILILYLPCRWFAAVKKAHPHSLLRFL